MLARLQRTLALARAPSRFSRQLSTSPQSSNLGTATNDSHFITDDLLLQEETPTPLSFPSTSANPTPPESTTSLLTGTTPLAPNGLSYAGLPENKIFLDIPPAQDPLIKYLTSSLQHDGRRHTAERRAARTLLFLHTLTRGEPLGMLREAVTRVAPAVRIARHRKSAKDVQIPVALNEKQQVRHAVKWMLKASDSRGGRTVEERLAREIVLVLSGSSGALRQKETLHQTAMVNRGNIPLPRRGSK